MFHFNPPSSSSGWWVGLSAGRSESLHAMEGGEEMGGGGEEEGEGGRRGEGRWVGGLNV